MRCGSSQGSTGLNFVAAVLLMGLSSVAMGQSTVLRGGGDTLPAIGYTASNAMTLISPAGSSMLAQYAINGGVASTYCPLGGGAGKKVLAGNDVARYVVNGACLPGQVPAGFGAAAGENLTQPHFAASAAPLYVSEFNNYVAGHGLGSEPVQLPSIAGIVGIVFKKSGVNTLTLNETQICRIFSGAITDWSALSPTASGPIRIVYPKEDSGTSFSFLNHLSAVCPANGGITQFKTNPSFAIGAAAYISAYSQPVPSAVGDPYVVSYVNGLDGVDGSIGFAEVANGTLGAARMASIVNSHSLATVNPVANFGPTALPVTLSYDKVLGDAVDANGRPVLIPASSTHQCVAVVDPSTYADPTTGYPILAVSYLLANRQGNRQDVAAVRGLLGASYNTTLRPKVTRIGIIASGYAWLVNADLTQSKVDACIAN